MRKSLMTLAAGTAILASPALAQLNVGGAADVGVGANVGTDVGQTVGNVTGTATDQLGKTVEQVDGTVNNVIDTTKLTVATREQVRAGVQVVDSSGNSIGTVQSIDGSNAVVVDGGKLYNVPLASLYNRAAGTAQGLVTKLPRAKLQARAEAKASADAS